MSDRIRWIVWSQVASVTQRLVIGGTDTTWPLWSVVAEVGCLMPRDFRNMKVLLGGLMTTSPPGGTLSCRHLIFLIKVRFQQNLVFTQEVLSLIWLVDRRLIRPMFELQIGGRHWILGRPVGGFAAWATGDTRDRPTCATTNLRRPASEGHVTF